MSVFDVVRAFKLALETTISDVSANLLTTIDPTATPTADAAADATAAGEAILAAIGGGFTLQTFTSTNSSWSVPLDLASAVEAYAIAVGGGGKGANGDAGPGTTTVDGGVGGSSGGYTAEKIDPSALGSTLNVTIGAAASTAGADGGTTSIVDTDNADTLVQSVVNIGALATLQGYVPSNSLPGTGGAGGPITASVARESEAGESNAFATGGTACPPSATSTSGGRTGDTGGAGGAGQTSDTPLAGGAGGGGGGSSRCSPSGTATGGTGGAGGFPGAGSGGGGAAGQSSGTPNAGPAGTPGNGFAALIWR